MSSSLLPVPPGPGPAPRPTAALTSPRGAIVCAAACVALAAAAVVGLVTTDRSASHPARGAGAAATTSAVARSEPDQGGTAGLSALAWARRSLPLGTNVLVDAADAPAFRAVGLRPVAPAGAANRGARFVVDSPGLRSAAAHYPAVASALRRAVTVARFGTDDGAGRVVVGQLVRVEASALASAADTRIAADRQLLANPAVRPSPSAAAVLRAGRLDLRAATVVAVLAAAGRIEITDVPADGAEEAAAQPARIIDVRTGDASGTRRQLAALTGAYRPMGVSATSDGTLRVTWAVDVTPVVPPR